MKKKRKSPRGLVDEVEAYVRKLPRKERAKIGGQFHAFYLWPEELPMKPEGWDNMSRDERFEISATICDQLDDKAWSWKAALKYWYVNVSGRSKKAFRRYLKSINRRSNNSIPEPYVMGFLTGMNVLVMIINLILATR